MRALAVAVLAAAFACSGDNLRREAEEAVRAYDRAVISAHLTGRFGELELAATPAEVERVRVLVYGLKEKGEELHASLEHLYVARAERLGDGSAQAIAEERWWYERVDARTRRGAGAATLRAFDVRYSLARVGGRWVVARVELTAPSRPIEPPAQGPGR